MSSAHKGILISSSPSVYLLFPFLIALARTSSMMLNSSGERGRVSMCAKSLQLCPTLCDPTASLPYS